MRAKPFQRLSEEGQNLGRPEAGFGRGADVGIDERPGGIVVPRARPAAAFVEEEVQQAVPVPVHQEELARL